MIIVYIWLYFRNSLLQTWCVKVSTLLIHIFGMNKSNFNFLLPLFVKNIKNKNKIYEVFL